MGDYQKATQAAVTQAEAWANESAKLWLDTYTTMVGAAADGSGKANDTGARRRQLVLPRRPQRGTGVKRGRVRHCAREPPDQVNPARTTPTT